MEAGALQQLKYCSNKKKVFEAFLHWYNEGGKQDSREEIIKKFENEVDKHGWSAIAIRNASVDSFDQTVVQTCEKVIHDYAVMLTKQLSELKSQEK